MTVGFRLVKAKWADTGFSGEGARKYGGRWNGKSYSCVYLAASESLALLEIIVHLDSYALLRHYRLFQIEIPPELIDQLPTATLPPRCRDNAPPEDTALIGNAWLDDAASGLALAVPSIIVPRETNYLLDPLHPHYAEVVSQAEELEFVPDPRLLSQ
jgi:RES domain-containing protein